MIEHHHWTVEEINAVRLLAEEKMMKPLEIALHTGFTKNAIVGLCFRKNIYLNNKRVFKNKAAPKPPDYVLPRRKIKKCIPLPDDVVVANGSVGFPAAGYCASIIGEPKFLRSCPCRVKQGSSWCQDHYAAYVVPDRNPRI